jgi:hypothetical protein
MRFHSVCLMIASVFPTFLHAAAYVSEAHLTPADSLSKAVRLTYLCVYDL